MVPSHFNHYSYVVTKKKESRRSQKKMESLLISKLCLRSINCDSYEAMRNQDLPIWGMMLFQRLHKKVPKHVTVD